MKKIKMVLYGEPGTGKSVFAGNAPKPFFITTDGNYEWLEGLIPEYNTKNHIQVNSWEEFEKAIELDFTNYETIVVDLIEDLEKWIEYSFCQKNKITHLSDMGYGKAYEITRNRFFITISKLLAMDKNIILISHGAMVVEKDRYGTEHYRYVPSNRIPDKLWDMIEGRVRYFLRCYVKNEAGADSKQHKKRYLSLIPKDNEFGIIRGVDESSTPTDIELNWDKFIEIINGKEKK